MLIQLLRRLNPNHMFRREIFFDEPDEFGAKLFMNSP